MIINFSALVHSHTHTHTHIYAHTRANTHKHTRTYTHMHANSCVHALGIITLIFLYITGHYPFSKHHLLVFRLQTASRNQRAKRTYDICAFVCESKNV